MPAVPAVSCALLAGVLIVQAGAPATTVIKTPFELVSLWSDEMLDYLMGEKQPPCSGENASKCQRLNAGVCDDTAYFRFQSSRYRAVEVPPRTLAKQSKATNPQSFNLELPNAGYSHVGNIHDYAFASFTTLELAFRCNGDACPVPRFQIGSVQRIDLSVLNGQQTFDLTRDARILPDGPIVATIDDTVRSSLFEDTQATYQVRVVAECFSVAPAPKEWKFPVHESPSAGADALGVVIARVTPGSGMAFTYQPASGPPITFEPDWVEPDWSYTFLMEHTILDRDGDWVRLPARPFPKPVWIQLPGRRETPRLQPGTVYKLSKALSARRSGAEVTATFDAGTIIIVLAINGRTVEFRKEEPFDVPCGEAVPRPPHPPPTYVIDGGDLYDADSHLAVKPVYTKGC